MEELDENQKGISIEDFVSVHKLQAFCTAYRPADGEGAGVEVFNDARLRRYFTAYPGKFGDPLNWYLEELSQQHFTMKNSLYDEPVIFARRKPSPNQQLALDDAFGKDENDINENVDLDDIED